MKARADISAVCCLLQPSQAGRVLRGVGLRAAADSGRLLLRPTAGQCGASQRWSLKSGSNPALRHCHMLHHGDLQARIPASRHQKSEMMMTCPASEKITYVRRRRYDTFFKIWQPFNGVCGNVTQSTVDSAALKTGPVVSDVTAQATCERNLHITATIL